MMGIIQSMVVLLCLCWGSPESTVIIFCCTHMVAPVRRGMMKNLSGTARSSHKKLLSRGILE